jgi:hypothetical protein
MDPWQVPFNPDPIAPVSLYEPNQHVISSGQTTCEQPVSVRIPAKRTLESGDQVVLILKRFIAPDDDLAVAVSIGFSFPAYDVTSADVCAGISLSLANMLPAGGSIAPVLIRLAMNWFGTLRPFLDHLAMTDHVSQPIPKDFVHQVESGPQNPLYTSCCPLSHAFCVHCCASTSPYANSVGMADAPPAVNIATVSIGLTESEDRERLKGSPIVLTFRHLLLKFRTSNKPWSHIFD